MVAQDALHPLFYFTQLLLGVGGFPFTLNEREELDAGKDYCATRNGAKRNRIIVGAIRRHSQHATRRDSGMQARECG